MNSLRKKYIYINLAIVLLVIMVHIIMPEAFCIQLAFLTALALYNVYMNLCANDME